MDHSGACLGSDRSQRLIPLDQSPVSDWPTELVLDKDRSFWNRIGQTLGLGNLDREVPDDPDKRLRSFLESDTESIDRKVFASEEKELLVAFAFPYQTPCLVRKNLHSIFNYRTVTANPINRRSAIEAPIALALECVAQRKAVETVNSTASMLLLTGDPPMLELTGASLVREGNLLRIAITAYAAIDIEPDAIVGSLRHFGGNPSQAPLFHAGIADSAEKVVDNLERSDRPSAVIDMGLHAVAIGAVRHGGLLLDGQLWLNNKINRLEVTRTSPVALGVLGTVRVNGAEEWCWRRIVEKGRVLGTSRAGELAWKRMVNTGMNAAKDTIRAGLNLSATDTEKVALAECPHPEFASKQWLSQKHDWAKAGLRWHEIVPIEEAPSIWDLEVKMSPINRQRWHGLTCPTWKIVPSSNGAGPNTAEPVNS